MASDTSADAAEVERLYEFGERLNEAKDKSEVPSPFFSHSFPALRLGALFPSLGFAFEALAKQLAAQLIPRFFKFFPGLSSRAVTALFDLVEEDDLGRHNPERKLLDQLKDQVDYKKRNDSVLLAVTSVLLAFNRVQLQCLFTAPHSLVELPKLEEMCNAVK
ncbi:hypothetical protein GW17_00038670 [Ensete ventricosum]|nr:hypothetical protein GW17_00038670 [Ensete ventricosum]